MKVAVVGAGIAGLTCAYRLARSGHDVVVFESANEVGGRMSTVDAGGFSIDVGANLLLDNYDRTQALARDVGIGDQWFELEAGPGGGVLRDDEVTSFAPEVLRDVLRYRGLSLRARVELARFLRGARRFVGRLEFFDLSVGDLALDDVDADTYFRTRYGDELVDWLIDPFVRTFHFHAAKRISMKYFEALAALFVSESGFSIHGFRGFMRALPDALAARLEVVRGVPIDEVRSQASGVVVRGPRVESTFDSAVVAVPAYAARSLLASGAQKTLSLLDSIRYSSTMMCAFRVRRDVAGDFQGIWVPFAQSGLIACCANETRKGSFDATHCLLVLGLHEEGAAALEGRDDAAVLAATAAEWTRLFPAYNGAMRGLLVKRWPAAVPVYAPGLVSRVARYWEDGQGDDRVFLAGDYLNHPWIEGSVVCGEKVASRIALRI